MDEASFDVKAVAGRKGFWRLTVTAEALTFSAREENESFSILRTEREEKTELHESRFAAPSIFVYVGKKRVAFKLEKDQLRVLKRWLGPPTILGLKIALKRRLKWCLPIGILFIIVSIPLPGDPEIGVEAIPFDVVTAFLGVALVGISLLARIWPRRVWFLLDGIWFLLLAADVAVGLYQGDSWWRFIILFFLILGAKSGFSEYQRFASVSLRERKGSPMMAHSQVMRRPYQSPKKTEGT